MREEETRKKVREGYARVAADQAFCCGSNTVNENSKKMGYTEEELRSAPRGANMSLGCGNPVAMASLREGETVVDLGSGGGFDCFLAAKRVGNKGKVIGVDMTPEMIDKARENARKGECTNVEFRLGEIENLPVADNTADAVISNCVINLAPNKKRVFEEAFRTLKPGGRLMVSDVVLLRRIPEKVRNRAHPASCVKTAIMKDEYIKTIEQAGFEDVRIIKETRESFEDLIDDLNAKIMVADPKGKTQGLKLVRELKGEAREMLRTILESTASIRITATKRPKR